MGHLSLTELCEGTWRGGGGALSWGPRGRGKKGPGGLGLFP